MIRPLYIWIGFAICLAIVVGAMGWISWTVLRLDAAEAEARQQAALEENVRLALWRMDSTVAPLIAQESTRPFFLYQSFYPANRPYARMFDPVTARDTLQPSPLLNATTPRIFLHFQYGPDGEVTSPQVPLDEWRARAIEAGVSEAELAVAALRLQKLRDALPPDTLLDAISGRAAAIARLAGAQEAPAPSPVPTGDTILSSQQIRDMIEYAKRKEVSQQVGAGEFFLSEGGITPSMGEAGMRALWINGMMLLARRVSINNRDYIQGCWLNWPEVRSGLLSEVRDLLPGADLEPVALGAANPRARMLTGLPVTLASTGHHGVDRNDMALAVRLPGNTALLVSLGVAWVCVALAAAAFVLLLTGVLNLNERRGAFVSAVTHELRTPLTSLRMYTEMLSAGMVRGDDKVREYLHTMNMEVDRLGHLVENVLTYSRLERGRGRGRIEALTIAELVDRVKHRLVQRAEQAGFQLAVEVNERRADAKVRVDITAVEQILFNLVDNACKYGRNGHTGEDRFLIHLQADRNGKWATLRVRDYGPGIKPDDCERLFKPFTKSAHDAAHTAPGVGLGLALSRRLARLMGGDLDLDPTVNSGACFVLTLPSVG